MLTVPENVTVVLVDGAVVAVEEELPQAGSINSTRTGRHCFTGGLLYT
jgi:hypothetical protein